MLNQKYNGAISVILAISSEGDYLAATLNKRLDFAAFVKYLKMIDSWIDTYSLSENKWVLILLNNCPIYIVI